MNCETARQKVSASLDGELRSADAAELESHLLDCASCRRERDEMRTDVTLLATALPTLSRGLAQRTIESLPTAPRTRITGLWLTGQDVLTCGVAGAMMADLLTVVAMVGGRKIGPLMKRIYA